MNTSGRVSSVWEWSLNEAEQRLFVIALLTAAANALAVGGEADHIAQEKMLLLTPMFDALAATDSFGRGSSVTAPARTPSEP